jgi:phosphatidylglycerophosphatase A
LTPSVDVPARTRALAVEWLGRRGVRREDIAALVLDLQRAFVPGLSIEMCLESVDAVLEKREVANALLTGIALDELAERALLPEPLQRMVFEDDHLYGIDEVMALSIVNIYGTIGLTNFGFLDKVKPGIVGVTDRAGHDGVHCNTCLDDLVSAVAAAAAARIAHRDRDRRGDL